MASDSEYICDREFVKLLTRRRDVDLTVAALELARDAWPDLDFQPTLAWIEARAAELAGPVARAKRELDALHELGRVIAEQHGVYGDHDSYDRADSSYLNRVVETGRGIPISLSLLYMGVARRAGLELKGVAAPMHFLTRYESVNGPLFIDAFSRGRVLTPLECKRWFRKITRTSGPVIESALRPVGPRTIILRMLNNLKALYARQQNWPAAWLVQHRLAALEPSSYKQRRDLALISLRADRPGHALDLLQSCLRTCPSNERDVLKNHLQTASTELARWN